MKAFVIEKPNSASIQDIPKPRPDHDEVLIKVKASGFCGTDIHTYKGEHPSTYPLVPGHEFSGIVEEIGPGVTQFKPGDPVVADPNIFCESCFYCKQNKQIHCENLKVIGNTRNGAFAEYVTAPERCTFSAEGLDLTQAAMAEPLGCVINAHNKIVPPLGGTIVIFGAGTIGLLHLLISQRRGAAKIAMVDVKKEQLALAQKLGASSVYESSRDIADRLKRDFPRGLDLVIDATGVPKVVETAIQLVAVTGTFMGFGACPTDSSIQINPFDLYHRDWKLIGSYALEKTMPQSLDMLRGGLDLAALIGRQIRLEEMPSSFADFMNSKTCNKTIVTF